MSRVRAHPHPVDPDDKAILRLAVRALNGSVDDRESNLALIAMVSPPAACPGCVSDAGLDWSQGTTSAFCPTHAARVAASLVMRSRSRLSSR